MEKVCPHCHETIEELYYAADVREYGTCDLDGSDTNCTDSNCDSCDYQCPKCEHAVELDDLLDEVPDEDEDDEEAEETPSIEEGGSMRVLSIELLHSYGSGTYEDKKALASCKRCKVQQVIPNWGEKVCANCGRKIEVSFI